MAAGGRAIPPPSWRDVRASARVLGWAPQLDDLDTIVAHALAWERRLSLQGRRSADDP